jgi:hypothetical protein
MSTNLTIVNARSAVEKADLAVSQLVSNGGYLNPAQTNTFLRMLIDQPTLINQIRTVPMNSPQMQINKIGFGQRILKKAPVSGTALASGDRSAPTTDKVELTTKEVIAEVHIPYDVLEDNIERGNIEDTIMSLIAERAALDLEELLLLGDTDSLDDYLALLDGMLKQATSHVVDYSASPVAISRAVFKEGIHAMPNKYLRNRKKMSFFSSPATELEYADYLGDRLSTLGDKNVKSDWQGNSPFGIPLRDVALMPDNSFLFTHPKNLIMGVQRKISMETDRDIRARVLIVVLTMRLDVKYEEVDAVVKCIGLNPLGATTTTT